MRFTHLAAALAIALLPTLTHAAEPIADSDSDPSAPSGRSGQVADRDSDGLTDEMEGRFGSDPNVADTDGDSYPDGLEVSAGYSPTSGEPTKLPKRIEVTLSKQELAYYLGDVELGRFPVSAGLPTRPTPVGEFKVYSKHPRAWSNRGKLWMPYWMAFHPGGLYGIHELPEWPSGKKEGAENIGKPASSGCVRLGVGPAELLYDWAPVGTKVVIRK